MPIALGLHDDLINDRFVMYPFRQWRQLKEKYQR
ncbi:hypothetical protein EA652_0335 [Wolbachia endosymbiont of Drosophila ananassae]|nr:hypothetical protein EA652_0335 [Wolbachia endosymbiont of Drosophila ananassae]